ncbi:MAG: hypothetical protein KA764_05885 [Anaerolineales bacterium]|nr:hypothetical protein [Anaerolineales bacterium]
MNIPLPSNVPDAILAAALHETAEKNRVLERRVVLMALLWDQGWQTQVGLMARTRLRLGRGCFGRRPDLAFRRDMQAVKKILNRAGQTLKYSRRSEQPGYYIAGRPAVSVEQARAIEGAAGELDPRQIAAWARLTPAARLRLADTLSQDVLALAIQAQRRQRPEQSPAEAQREVLHRYYQTAFA